MRRKKHMTPEEVSKPKAAKTLAKAVQAYAENIINSLHECVILLDRDLRVQAASACLLYTSDAADE